MNRIVIGTRGSLLARWQARFVADALREAYPDLVLEEKVVVTEGDRLSSGPLWNAGGKGLWVKEIEADLLAGRIDLAVHSMKDVPGELAPGLVIAAVPKRADVRDALVSRDGANLDRLPSSARVGTTSLRRTFQLKALRPDLVVEILRGNLDTRLRKVADRVVDAAVLACAGLDRLGFADRITERLPIERMLPAVGQGALAVETRADDAKTRALCRILDHTESSIAVTAERAFLARLGASCKTPVAGHARLQAGQIILQGRVGRPDGSQIVAAELSGPIAAAAEVGRAVADDLLSQGARAMLG
jgi:hydroxymethylbilane synthase